MMPKVTKVEMTEGFTMWTDGTHTVTILEVQAVKLAAGLHVSALQCSQDTALRTVSGFLLGQSMEADETVAQHIMEAKRREADAGRTPTSMEMIPQ